MVAATRSRKGKATRRRSTLKSLNSKGLTIPELKRSFDAVDSEVHALLKQGLPAEEEAKKFQAIWKRIFHRPVTKDAAVAYLQVKRASGTRPVAKHHTRKMKGGAAPLAGAPLDYMTRPGVDGAYGSFPAYQAQGLSFYNTINQQGITQECGVKDFTPKVSAMIGSNEPLKGGALKDLAHLAAANPIPASAPPGLFNDIQSTMQGKQLGASPAPESSKLTVF